MSLPAGIRAPTTWVIYVLSVLSVAHAQQPTGTALVRHAPTLNGSVEGSIQQMTPESTTFNGGAAVSGDLLVPGTPTVRLNGSPTYGGTQDGTGASTPADHIITLNGGAALRHVIRRTDAISLPAVASHPQPTGTRSVSLNNASQSAGDFATLKNLTLNGNVGQIMVPPGSYGDFATNGSNGFTLGVAGTTTPAVYNFQQLTLNGSSHLDLVGPVILTVANGVVANGNMGASANAAWLALKFASGGLTLNGNVSVYAYLTAPAGTVTINGNSQLVGGLIADRLTINGNGLLRLIAPVESNGLPFLANFEPAQGYQPGSLDGQKGWVVSGSATVGTSMRYAGQLGVAVAPAASAALLVHAFVNNDPSVTFVDVFALPAAAATAGTGVFLDTDAARVALTGAPPADLLNVFQGNGTGGGTWVETNSGPILGSTGLSASWFRLTVRTDYAGKKWDLYFNGRMIAADLGFVHNAQAAFTGLGLSGHATLTTGFDDVLIGFENPLFADADHDGMDDAWETAHGLNPTVNDRNGDPDGDGLTNVQEYILGTDPGIANDSGDLDNNGLPDAWETLYFGHAGINPSADADGDGWTNLQEFKLGRNPTKGAVADTAGAVNLRVYSPAH